MGTILCPVGQDVIPGSFFYDTMTATYSWECDFANGTSPATCEAYDSRCGDGIIGTGIGYPQFGNEECDENGNNGVPCIP